METEITQNTTETPKPTLWQLFITFFKIGAFTFGGGYAMISLIEEEIATRRKWATSADILDLIVVAESTPGVLAVNTATAVGYRTRGIVGAILATLGVVLPSFLIIFALSFFVEAFSDNRWYKVVFAGIQICVCTLIFNAFVKVSKNITHDVFNYIVLVATFGVALFTNFPVIFLILIGAVLGLTIKLVGNKKSKTEKPPLTVIADENFEENSIDETDKPGTDKPGTDKLETDVKKEDK